MRALWILILTSLALPAPAQEKSEAITLRYIPAGELERSLLPGNAPRPVHVSLPAGLIAWSVDARQNALTVTGSDAAIQELKTVVRLLDVPPIPIQISVRWLRSEDPAVRALVGTLPAAPPAAKDTLNALLLTPEQSATLERLPAVVSATLDTANNRPLHLRSPGAPQQPGPVYTVVPRVNGDGTVALRIGRSDTPAEPGPAPTPDALRRVQPGSTVLLVPAASEAVLALRVRADPTLPAPPGKND